MEVAKKAGEKHPPGLYLLFAIEAWERFSYYGMRAILVLYMTKYLLFSTEESGHIYGWYTGFVYMTPLIGGYLADRHFGQRKMIMVGAILMAIGEFCLASTSHTLFYVGLGLLVTGNGAFKPNITAVVGKLYDKEKTETDEEKKINSSRRDAGMTIFYMGINLGAIFSPLVCGTLGEKVGWGWGFGAAGVGMLIGLCILLLGQKKYLGDVGLYPAGSRKQENAKDGPLTKKEKQQIAVIFILSFFVIFFFAAFEQAGSSLTLFADKETNRLIEIFGWRWEFPTSWFQAANPIMILIFAPLFSRLWLKLGAMGKEPSTPTKMATGLALLAMAFVLMALSAINYQQFGPVSMLWLLGCYLMCTLGELCLSPIGLSMVTKLSPAKFTGLMVGVFFLAVAAANLVGGLFAGNYDEMNHATFFMIPVATAGISALILFLLAKPIKKMMHGV